MMRIPFVRRWCRRRHFLLLPLLRPRRRLWRVFAQRPVVGIWFWWIRILSYANYLADSVFAATAIVRCHSVVTKKAKTWKRRKRRSYEAEWRCGFRRRFRRTTSWMRRSCRRHRQTLTRAVWSAVRFVPTPKARCPITMNAPIESWPTPWLVKNIKGQTLPCSTMFYLFICRNSNFKVLNRWRFSLTDWLTEMTKFILSYWLPMVGGTDSLIVWLIDWCNSFSERFVCTNHGSNDTYYKMIGCSIVCSIDWNIDF